MNNQEYVRLSLELHLFFDRIMKEHSFFLEAAFTEKDNKLKKIANNFQKVFSDILENVITLADGNITNDLIQANEIVTVNTLEAENKSINLSGIPINTNITLRENNLRSGRITLNEQLINSISSINKQALPVIENLIHFKNDILNQVLSCRMYTTNYPLLIEHIMDEAKVYYKLLTKVENKEPFTQNYLYEQELRKSMDFPLFFLQPKDSAQTHASALSSRNITTRRLFSEPMELVETPAIPCTSE